MASSSHRRAAPSISQRFYEYLNGLQEEFEHRSNDTSRKGSSSRRFNIYLGNLKGEFELMSLEIETLREKYKEKVEMQTKKLQGVGPNLVCERCSTMETTGAPQITVPTKPKTMKTTASLFSTPFSQFKTRDKLGTSRGVDVIQGMTSHRPSQHTTIIQKLHSILTYSQFVSHLGSAIFSDSQTVAFPSPLPQVSASTANPNVVPEEHDGSIQFNNEVEMELDVEIAHTLSDGDMMRCECVKFSRDGKYLAAGCWDGKAYIYNVEAGTLNCVLRNLLAEEDRVISVCFSHDGRYLATGSWDGVLFVWEIKTKYVRNAFKGHTEGIMSLDFSPNGRLLLSASADNTVRLWNMRGGSTKLLTEENLTIFDVPRYTSAVFSPDGSHVAASHCDGVVKIWNVHTGRLTKRMEARHSWANSVAFVPDGKGLVSGGGDGKPRYWDVSCLDSTRFRSRPQTTKHSRRRGSVEEWMRQEQEFAGHEGPVYSIATSPDGRWIASGSYDQSVRIWDSSSAATQCILNHGDRVLTVDFSPAGSYLASGGIHGTLRIWRYSSIASGDS